MTHRVFMPLKWLIVVIAILINPSNLLASPYDSNKSIDLLLPHYDLPDYFIDSFNDLNLNHWDSSGNWAHDVQNDATAFAPELLYLVDKQIGQGRGEFYKRAYETSLWQNQEMKRAFNVVTSGASYSEWFVFNTAVGTYSYVSCAQHAKGLKDALCKFYMSTIISLANFAFISPIFDTLGLFEGKEATLYARLVFMNTEFYKSTGKEKYKEAARKLIEKMKSFGDSDDDGIYDGDIFGWSQASPLVAFASAYEITGDEHYLAEAQHMIDALDEEYLFGIIGETEAYWEVSHNSIGSDSENVSLASSTHVQFMEAFAILAISTEDDYYLVRANRFLEFAVQYFYLPNVVGSDVKHFAHDISWPVDQIANPNADLYVNQSYCTGESFNILRVAFKLMSFEKGL